jgi:hypothetical protein
MSVAALQDLGMSDKDITAYFHRFVPGILLAERGPWAIQISSLHR